MKIFYEQSNSNRRRCRWNDGCIKGSENGHDVTLLEKNEKLGKKLFITGKGRCNVTNASDMETIMSQIVTNPRFLYSAFSDCSNTDVMELIEKADVRLR